MTPSSPPLEGLREIHVPPPVAWFPPAPGWGIVVAVLVGGVVGGRWWWRRRRRVASRSPDGLAWALAEVDRLQSEERPEVLVAALSGLLKRAALGRFPRQEVAPLWGEAWLEFLDRAGGFTEFTRGSGRVLAEAGYRPRLDEERVRELPDLVRRWLRKILAPGQ